MQRSAAHALATRLFPIAFGATVLLAGTNCKAGAVESPANVNPTSHNEPVHANPHANAHAKPKQVQRRKGILHGVEYAGNEYTIVYELHKSPLTLPAVHFESKTMPEYRQEDHFDSVNKYQTLDIANPHNESAVFLSSLPVAGWLSETELEGGEIPAALISDEELGVPLGDANFVDPFSDYANGEAKDSSNILQGMVTKNVGHRPATLRKGSVIFHPSVDTLVNTPYGKIKIAAHSLTMVIAAASGVSIYDLDDAKKGAVQISIGDETMALSPGQHLLVTNSKVDKFDRINPTQLIGYRNMQSRTLANGYKVFTSEFSVPHAIHAVQPLKHLVKAPHPEARKVTDHLLKTIAAIMQIRGADGNFQQVLRPQTSWN